MDKHNAPHHWAAQNERGNRFFLTLTAWIVRYCPNWLIRPVVIIVSFYYYLTSANTRRHIQSYQNHLRATYGNAIITSRTPRLAQIMHFADAITDRFAVWQHKITIRDITIHRSAEIERAIVNPQCGERGQILVCSHLGNVEISRAFAQHYPKFTLNVLIHNAHAKAFNEALKKAGATDLRLIQVTELDAATMLNLAERIEAGEWIAIAADRIPVRGEKIRHIDFLGAPAPFAEGPWILAGLLRAPINTLFCLKEKGRYHVYFERFSDSIGWNRGERMNHIENTMKAYAERLGEYCARAPLQWYNFYDFWQEHSHEKE